MKWKDYTREDIDRFYADVGEKTSYFNELADGASVRKSKYLSAVNSGGIITLLSFVGALKISLSGLVLLSLVFFLIGLVLNGAALFLAEKRLVGVKIGYIECINAFTKHDSDITITDFNNNVRSVIYTDTNFENRLELYSGLAFIFGTLFLFSYFY